MRLARGFVRSGPATVFAIEQDRAVPVSTPESTDPLLALLRDAPDWPSLAESVAARLHSGEEVIDAAALHLLAALARPGKIIAIGLNYVDHTAETGLDAPTERLSFAKYPTSVIGPGAVIRVPTALTTQVDWEGELGAVIGRANVGQIDQAGSATSLDTPLPTTCQPGICSSATDDGPAPSRWTPSVHLARQWSRRTKSKTRTRCTSGRQ